MDPMILSLLPHAFLFFAMPYAPCSMHLLSLAMPYAPCAMRPYAYVIGMAGTILKWFSLSTGKPEGQTGGIKRNHFYRRRMNGKQQTVHMRS